MTVNVPGIDVRSIDLNLTNNLVLHTALGKQIPRSSIQIFGQQAEQMNDCLPYGASQVNADRHKLGEKFC